MKTTSAENSPTSGPDASESPAAVLRSAGETWLNFFFAPRDPTGLSLMRICVGLIVLYVHLAYSFGLQSYVGREAWLNGDVIKWMRFETEVIAPSDDWSDRGVFLGKGSFLWSIYFHVEDPTWIAIIHTGFLIAMALFTVGFCTRVTSVLTWLGVITYIHRTPALLFGMDTMTNLATMYLMIAPCGAALSVDRWLEIRRQRREHGLGWVPPPPEPLSSATFATRLIQINFCIIYFASGTSKLLGSSWWNGTAPNLVLLNYNFAPFSVGLYSEILVYLARMRWLWEIFMSMGVIFTLFVELGLPFLVWNRRMRWVMVCGSVLLHTAIGLFMNLVTFSLVMISMLLAFFPPEAIRKTLERYGEQLAPLFRRGPQQTPPAGRREPALTAK